LANFGADDFDFAAEFAEFAGYVGTQELFKVVRKVVHKLSLLDPAPRRLFGTRYFFHEQIDEFTEGALPFILDASSPLAVRAATLIAGVNRAKAGMSDVAQSRLRRMMLDNLTPDRDIRQIEHEFRAFIHVRQMFSAVEFADLEGHGNFDLLCTTGGASVEVECKTVSEDTGNPIKNEMVVNLSQIFLSSLRKRPPVDESGLFYLKFKSDPGSSKTIQQDLKSALAAPFVRVIDCQHATIDFLPRPTWRSNLETLPPDELRNFMSDDPDIKGRSHCFTKIGADMFALVLETSRMSMLAERIPRILKDAADQLSGTGASMIWLHFVGFAEEEFRALVEFSKNGMGGGLNALVAEAVSPGGSSFKDRSHVNVVRFSGEPVEAQRHSTATEEGVVHRTSMGGAAYDVRNPFARHQLNIKF
jgi:hypothetical protein